MPSDNKPLTPAIPGGVLIFVHLVYNELAHTGGRIENLSEPSPVIAPAVDVQINFDCGHLALNQ